MASFGMFKIYFECQKVGFHIFFDFGWLYGSGPANSTLQSVSTVSTCQSAIYLHVVFPVTQNNPRCDV